ncbi:sugar transferase [Mesorhizobium sp. SP-1A]|uniref:sugar transferase n=1 Tax=Mesorhizobium sp. SP-1A TaxID=3077840 RepID=UPI0028F6DC8A|nr:sugar transferase [Mesorhizobium sp. SP-1A]
MYFSAKRVLDVTTTLVSAPLLLPLVGCLALIVSRDGGRAFYGQARLGKDGTVFRIWKLRSMVPDADARLEEYLAQNPVARQEWESTQKLRHDPRITALGRYLRKYSLDELPQFWNVLLGQMSLVGPRPMFPEQKPLYPGTAYFDVRPGLTGLWQVSERNRCSFAERADYDTVYARTMSLRTDFMILLRTVAVVMRGTGC